MKCFLQLPCVQYRHIYICIFLSVPLFKCENLYINIYFIFASYKSQSTLGTAAWNLLWVESE